MTISAREIVYSVGMPDRPEYYSGRGAMSCYLNGDQLYEIHTTIKKEIGTEQAVAFVSMIENLKTLSATNFLNSLYALEAREWVFVPASESDIDLGPDDERRIATGIATIFAATSFSEWDETEDIRASFFQKIHYTPKIVKQERVEYYDDFEKYHDY